MIYIASNANKLMWRWSVAAATKQERKKQQKQLKQQLIQRGVKASDITIKLVFEDEIDKIIKQLNEVITIWMKK